MVRVAPVPVAPSPLCLSVCPDTALSIRLRGTTCTFASGDAAPLLGLLSRQARHESNCNSIVVSLRHLPLYSTPPPLYPPLPAVLLLAPFPFWRLSGKMFELLFCPTAICGENFDLLLSARDSHQLSTSSRPRPRPPRFPPPPSRWSSASRHRHRHRLGPLAALHFAQILITQFGKCCTKFCLIAWKFLMKCFAFAFAIAIAVAIALKPLLLPHQTEPSRTGTEIEIETETVTESLPFPLPPSPFPSC